MADWFGVLGLLIVGPLFAYAALFGEMPPFLVNWMSDDMYDDLTNTDKFFTRFGPHSIGFALAFLLCVFLFLASRVA